MLNPNVHFTADSIAICANDNTFSLWNLLAGDDLAKIIGKQDGLTYNLTSIPSGLSIDNSIPETYLLNPAASTAREYILSLEVFHEGCSVTKTAKFVINPTPASFYITSDRELACDSAAVPFTASNSGTAGLTYQLPSR